MGSHLPDDEVARRMLRRREVTESGCWLWTGAKQYAGYGRMRFRGRLDGVHRVAHILWVGPIPDGLHVDHLCRNRACFNPEHLEAVTNRENALRGESLNARRARQTHCIRGHEFTPENTRVRPTGHRQCRQCGIEYANAWRQLHRPARASS